ncbi:MAG: uracil-DNA glycosylase [Planctomycetes bacterium]|nr:uracil-DNA glycosylase [Planctomycetota bacterium]
MTSDPPIDSQQELRELVAGARRHVELLREEGAIGGFGSAPELASPPPRIPPAAAPQPVATERDDSSKAPTRPAPAPAPSPAADASPWRASFVSERGSVHRSAEQKANDLAALADAVRACRLCRLCEARRNAVPGEGSPTTRVMFVGEGPGATEDAQGRPFVGAAGQLLTRIIESGMQLRRADVFIANVVKCRPPENRDPAPDEAAACTPYLLKQIEIIDPEVIIPLGRHSMRVLAGTGEREGITRVRGQIFRRHGRAVIPTFHPAYLLRSPEEKPKAWHDIQLAMKELGLPLPDPKKPPS